MIFSAFAAVTIIITDCVVAHLALRVSGIYSFGILRPPDIHILRQTPHLSLLDMKLDSL